jgi:DNA-directed RNA polymerase specialized sigma24 family protein
MPSDVLDEEPGPHVAAAAKAEAWDRFYAYCFDIVRRTPSVRKLSGADQDDCVQDVMYEIVRKFGEHGWEELPEPENVCGWIRTVSRNKAVDITRRHYRHPEVGFADGSGADLPADTSALEAAALNMGESVSLVWDALLTLDQEVTMTSYLIFYLRTIENWATTAIAEVFNLTPEQTKFRCHRVKKRFAEILKSKQAAAGGDDETD